MADCSGDFGLGPWASACGDARSRLRVVTRMVDLEVDLPSARLEVNESDC